ncbi:MAG: PepSY domain-containing protein, partial [Rhodospirillales bacterium]|nr:PepSY domain-containing protein [Rhodospirillales bacterium]
PRAGLQVEVDPVSLEATAREPGSGVLRQMARLHANLLIPGRLGRQIIGWFGVAMLVLGVSGLVLWWPKRDRWRAAFVVKRGAGRLRLLRDLHGAVGIWTLLVFLLVTFSGVFLAFPQSTGAVIASVFPARDLRAAIFAARVEPRGGAERIGIDRAIELARAAIPDGRLVSVALPVRPEQPYRIGLLPADYAEGGPIAWVLIDPWSARVLEILHPRDYTTGETIMAWQHGLHEGAGLGPIWRGLVFMSGFLPPLFVVTGIWMWLLKRRARRVATSRYRAAAFAEAAD